MSEGFPVVVVEQQPNEAFEARLEELGGIEAVQGRVGLGKPELEQTVTFGNWTGTMLEAIADPNCPLGSILQKAHEEGGLPKVEKKLDALSEVDSRFELPISEETRQTHALQSGANLKQNAEPAALLEEKAETSTPEKPRPEAAEGARPSLEDVRKETRQETEQLGAQAETKRIIEISKEADFETDAVDISEEEIDEGPESEAVPDAEYSERSPESPEREIEASTFIAPEAEDVIDDVDAGEPVLVCEIEEIEDGIVETDGPLLEDKTDALDTETTEGGEEPETVESDVVEASISEEVSLEAPELEDPQTLPATVAERVVETLDLPDEQQAQIQIETLVAAVPETVQVALIEYMDTAELENVEAVGELVAQIAEAADRLHELFTEGPLESEEAQKIEELIIAHYEELLTELGLEVDEEAIARLITYIKSEDFKPAERQAVEEVEDVMHEKKPGLSTLAQTIFFQGGNATPRNVGQLAVFTLIMGAELGL